MRWVKFTSILLTLVTLISLVSCGSVGGGNDDTSTVLTVDEHKVSYDTYRYFYMNYKAENSNYTDKEIQEKCISAIKTDIGITVLAEKYGVKLTSEDKEKIDSYVESVIESYGGKEEYYSQIEKHYLTGDLFRYLYSQQLLEEKLRDHMYDEKNDVIRSDDNTFDADLNENFMAVKQLLITNDEGDDPKENKELADSLFERIQNGEDLDTLCKEYSEYSTADGEYVYYFTHGQTFSEFEHAVLDTDIGSLCDHVVETEAGYHIFLRTELDTDYINANYEELRTAFKARRFNEIREETANSLKVEYKDNFDNLSFQ